MIFGALFAVVHLGPLTYIAAHIVPMAAASVDPLTVLLNYGGLGVGLGVVFYLFVTGKIHTDGEYREMKGQRDRLAEALFAVQQQTVGHTLPTIGRVSDLVQHLPEAAGVEAAAIRELQSLVAEMKDVIGRAD